MKSNINLLIPFTLSLCFSVSCSLFNKEQSVAKVGKTELTRAELDMRIEQIGTNNDFENAQRQFVNKWVDRELLYQEALQNKFETTQFMEAEIERIRKNMIVNLFLKSQIDSIIYTSDKEIKDYYTEHSHEFIAESDYFQFVSLKVFDQSFSQQIQKELNNGTDINIVHATSPDLCEIVSSGSDYLPDTILDNLFAAELKKLKTGSNFTRVGINNEIYYVKLMNHVEKGETKSLEMVFQSIQQILMYNKYQKRYTDLISRLRKSYSFEITLGVSAQSVEQQ